MSSTRLNRERPTSNAKAYVYNLIILLIAIASIVSLFLGTFWKADFSVTPDEKIMKDAFKDILAENNISEKDFEKIIRDNPITANIGFSLEPKTLINSLIEKDGKAMVEGFITEQVDGIVDTLRPTLKQLAKLAANTVVEAQIKSYKKSLMESNGLTEEEIDAKFESVGINDSYVKTKTEELVDTVFVDNATPDTVANKVIDMVDEIVEKIKSNEEIAAELGDVEFTEADKAEAKEEIKKVLADFTDKNGNINFEAALAKLLRESMNKNGENNENGESENAKKAASILTANDEEKEEDLATTVKDLIMSYVDDGTIDVLVIVLKVMAGILLAVAASWAYLIIKLIVRLFTRNQKTVGLAVPRAFGWIPFTILVILPWSISMVLKSETLMTKIYEVLNMGQESVDTINSVIGGISMSFWSWSVVSFAGTVVLMFLLIFGYRRLRKDYRIK